MTHATPDTPSTNTPQGRLGPGRWLAIAVIGLVAIFELQLISSVRQQSQTWDEAYHLLAGYRYLQQADYGINPEHPPLVKWLAALPLLPLHLKVPHVPQGTSKYEGFVAARKFLFANDADALLFRSRLAVSLLTLLLALLVFEAARSMFGAGPALLALALLVFEPNILAHGGFLTTDAAMACCFFAAVYSFYRYVKSPTTRRLAECGFVAGLALAVKHSGILVFPVLGLLASLDMVLEWRSSKPAMIERRFPWARAAGRRVAALAVIGMIAVVILWACYGFRFRARPTGQSMTPPLADYLRGGGSNPGLKSPVLSRAILELERWRLLPESYLYGLTDVLIVLRGPRPSFLLGELYSNGQWFYFPTVFLMKSTPGFLLLLLLAIYGGRALLNSKLRELWWITIPVVFYFVISLNSNLNMGVRHLLPVYPFLAILAGAGGWTLVKRHRAWKFALATILALHIVSSLRSYPHYLTYGNDAFGGPKRTYKLLADSNVDWGQGLKDIQRYLAQRGIKDCWFAYFGSADPDYYGIPCKLLPDVFSVWWGKPLDVVPEAYEGTVLVGATQLAGIYWGPREINPYSQFRQMQPVDTIAGSTLVFRGRFDLRSAAQWSRANKAWELLANRKLDEALLEARRAVELGPTIVYARYTLGYMLAQNKQPAEARREYEAALTLARSNHPEYQWYWIPFLQRLLASP